MTRLLRRSVPLSLLMALAFQSSALAATADVSIVRGQFSPQEVMIKVGSTVVWTNTARKAHTTTAEEPFLWDMRLEPDDVFEFRFTAAGAYTYICLIHGGMFGSIAVRPKALPSSGPAGTQFQIKPATEDAADPFVYDIQKRDPGGAFQNWMTGVTSETVVFDSTGLPPGQYQFRSRLRNGQTGDMSDFSPPASVTVTLPG